MKLIWYGHSAFRIEIGGSVLLIDPFLKGNPTFESSGICWDHAVAGVTHIALTHGHDDHVGDTVKISKATGATVFAVYELALHLGTLGLKKLEPMGQGGTIGLNEFSITMTHAQHSSSSNGVYLGTACGLIIDAKEGPTLYHMGDTDIFSDMELINTLYKPDIGIVPIGDRFTMGGRTAAYACKKYFCFKEVVPCHYGTFSFLEQSADFFVSEMVGQSVLIPQLGIGIEV
ncbi:MAG: hypothetical protein TECD_00071 [Hyphomicrobiaceae bacterium hypho_1]